MTETLLPVPRAAATPVSDGVLATSVSVRAATLDVAKLQSRLEEIAPSPAIFERHPPYFFAAVASNDRVDAYSTRMSTSTLKNFAEDAQNGVSFQNSHNNYQLGLGRSLTGKYVGPNGPGPARFEADFYTMEGLATGGGMSTDEFITRVMGGIAFDVSVGFYGGEIRCSICGGRMLTYRYDDPARCRHIPGEFYDKRDPKKPETPAVREMAIGLIENARLAEVSIVYDGACPGAGIVKAQQEAAAGRLVPSQARAIEQRYRSMGLTVDLSEARSTWAGWTPDPAKGRTMEHLDGQNPETPKGGELERLQTALRGIRERLTAAGVPQSETEAGGVAHLATRVKELDDELAKLRPLAKFGEQARAALIDEAIKAGVKARGNAFDKPRYERILNAEQDLDGIRQFRDEWLADAAAAGIGAENGGGRKVSDTPGRDPETTPKPQRGVFIPIEALRA